MPDKAHKDSKTGEIVRAKDCSIVDRNKRFYCITPGCPAVMSLVLPANEHDAYFRRLTNSPKHISTDCVRCSLIFDPSKYDESKFNLNDAFAWMLSPTVSNKGTTGRKTGHVGGGAHNSLRTLGNIYKMCASAKKSDTYNGYIINDMFADSENYAKYQTDLIGNIIVECSFYKKVYKESALLFNYPADYKTEHIIIRLNFLNQKECWDYYKKLKDSDHTEPIAIAGNWEEVIGHPDCKFQCTFLSSRQLYVVR